MWRAPPRREPSCSGAEAQQRHSMEPGPLGEAREVDPSKDETPVAAPIPSPFAAGGDSATHGTPSTSGAHQHGSVEEEPRGAATRRHQGGHGGPAGTGEPTTLHSFLLRQDSASMQGSGYSAEAPSDADSDILLQHLLLQQQQQQRGGHSTVHTVTGREDSASARRGRFGGEHVRRDSASDLVPGGPDGPGSMGGASGTAAAAFGAAATPGENRRPSPLPRPPARPVPGAGTAAAPATTSATAGGGGAELAAAAEAIPSPRQPGQPAVAQPDAAAAAAAPAAAASSPCPVSDTLLEARAVVLSREATAASSAVWLPPDCRADSYQIASSYAKDPDLLQQARQAVLGRRGSGGSVGPGSPTMAVYRDTAGGDAGTGSGGSWFGSPPRLQVLRTASGDSSGGPSGAERRQSWLVDSPRERAARLAEVGLGEPLVQSPPPPESS